MRRICTVGARGGSKGVPNKNLRTLAGAPLIVHSLRQARASGLFDIIAVTTDSPEIRDIARAHGADFLVERPPELATDTAAKLPALQHCVRTVEQALQREFEVVVDLDPTSPLRFADDIVQAVRLLETTSASNVVSATPARRSPYFNLVEVGEDGAVRLSKTLGRPITRRQDAPACYDLNASIYAWRRSAFDLNVVFQPTTALYIMPRERSMDIDDPMDFTLVEFLASRRTDLTGG